MGASGIDGYIGFARELTWGTAVTPDKFHAGFTGGGHTTEVARIPSAGLRAGRRVLSIRKPGAKTVGGQGNFELFSRPLAGLLEQMFGDVATTGAGPYTHVATPGDLTGKSLTVQIVKPDHGGTLRAFTYPGSKIAEWELACSVGELASLALTFTAKDEDLETAAAPASYETGATPFTFVEGSVQVAGAPVAGIKSLSLSANSTLRTDGHRLGSDLIREQLENGLREYTGELTADFEDLTQYNRYLAADQVAIELKFDNGTDSLTIAANGMFDGATPELEGPEILEQSLPFTVLSGTSDADAITATLANGEATV